MHKKNFKMGDFDEKELYEKYKSIKKDSTNYDQYEKWKNNIVEILPKMDAHELEKFRYYIMEEQKRKKDDVKFRNSIEYPLEIAIIVSVISTFAFCVVDNALWAKVCVCCVLFLGGCLLGNIQEKCMKRKLMYVEFYSDILETIATVSERMPL